MFHKSQVLFYLLLAFIAGVFAGSFWMLSQSWALVLMIIGIGIFAVSVYQRTFSLRGVLTGSLILFFAIGIIRFNSLNFSNSVLKQFAGREAGGKGVPVTLQGYVDDEPDINGSKAQIIFLVTRLIVPDRTISLHERTIISTNSYPRYQFGDTLQVNGAIGLPQNFSGSGFDYVQYLKNKDINTTVSYPKISADSVPLTFTDRLKIGLYRRIFIVKHVFEQSVSRSLADPYGPYINGILLGSRQNISPDLKDAFNKTSTTHILAISGYNITIIAEALLAALIYFIRRRAAFWVSVAVIILFTILTGAGASVVRAAIMGLLLLAANGYGRLYDPKNSILTAAGIMICFNPAILRFDIGFQLSFLAVIGLMTLYPILNQKTKNWPKKFIVLKETLLMTISAQIMVAPLLAYSFHQFSLVSLPANLLVLPLMPHTMLFGFLTGVAGLIFWPLGKAIGLFALALSAYQIKIITWFGALPFSSLNITIHWATLLASYIIIFLAMWRMNRIIIKA